MSEKYSRSYFEGEGYKFYRDSPLYYVIADYILEKKPTSVLELGCGRGYILRHIEDAGIKVLGIDISEHCFHTRVINNFLTMDVTNADLLPWSLKENKFDICISSDFFEHLTEQEIDSVIKESVRVSDRGIHIITFNNTEGNEDDKTHVSLHEKEWWIKKFQTVAPDYPVEILEKTKFEVALHQIVMPKHYLEPDSLVKVNIGSYLDMYYGGWQNLDALDLSQFAQNFGYTFKQYDARVRLPYEDATVDIILASHFIEHLTREEGKRFLRECERVLKPDGILRLVIPDAIKICSEYVHGDLKETYRHVNISVEKSTDSAEGLFHLLISGHQTIYDFKSLKIALEECGFINVTEYPPFKSQSKAIQTQTFSMYPTLSCYVEANPKKEIPLYKQYLNGKIGEGKTHV